MQTSPVPTVRKVVKDQIAYYSILWSSIKGVDKYDIQRTVPAMAGLFELFYREKDGKLHQLYYGKAWLGGLRAVIREMTDPLLMNDRKDIQRVLREYPCFYRFAVCESLQDLEDILGFFDKKTGAPEVSASGRYTNVRVREC